MIKSSLFLAGLALFACRAPAAADGATLRGKVVIRGRIVRPLRSNDDYGAGGDYSGYQEENPPAELRQQLIVYLLGLSLHASKERAVLSQKDRNFTASIVPVLPDQKLDIRNDDTVRHHIRSNTKPWDFNLRARPPGSTVTCTFGAASDGGLGVVPVYCDIHPYMRAHVLVMPTPKWQLLPETGGDFEFKNLPAGTYTLAAWHPVLLAKPLKVTLKKGQTKTLTLVVYGAED